MLIHVFCLILQRSNNKNDRVMTVIWCDWGDNDTAFVEFIYKKIDNCNVVRIKPTDDVEESLKKFDYAISHEGDTILFYGHGNDFGLFYPNRFDFLLLNNENVNKIKAKNIIGIWCYASNFAKSNELSGFFTNMFISNTFEATINRCYKYTNIDEQNMLFCCLVGDLLKMDIPLKDFPKKLYEMADVDKDDDDVKKFNYEGIRYFDFTDEYAHYETDYFETKKI